MKEEETTRPSNMLLFITLLIINLLTKNEFVIVFVILSIPLITFSILNIDLKEIKQIKNKRKIMIALGIVVIVILISCNINFTQYLATSNSTQVTIFDYAIRR